MNDQAADIHAVPLTALRPAPWNPRVISDERFQNLCRSIAADPGLLWRRPVLAQADGTIYAGNMRFRAAAHLGLTTIPAVLEDVPDLLARERAVRDNSQWGEWEQDELAALLAQLDADGAELELLGLEDRELQQLLDSIEPVPGATEPDEVPPFPEEPMVREGELWQLDEHRLVGGDCTDPGVLAELMRGQRATCMWTDPPYGVGYIGRTEAALAIVNDDRAGLHDLLERAFAAADAVLAPGAAVYVAHPAEPNALTFMQAFLAQGWRLHQTLVWVKSRLVLGHSDYHYRHEPILFGYTAGLPGRVGRGGHGWYGDDSATSVFEIPTPLSNAEHPTAKPVALIAPMLRNSSRSGEVVLDPFLGSGSTLIASERTGRVNYGVEIDPRYADVAIRRWQSFTGRQARRA